MAELGFKASSIGLYCLSPHKILSINRMMVIMIWHGCQIQSGDHFSPLISYLQFSSVQFSLVAQLCPTLCDPMNCSTPGFPVHHQLPELTQTHIHRVNDAIQPSHPPVVPFSSHLQSFPALGYFPMSQSFISGG